MNIINTNGFLMKYGKSVKPIIYSLRTLPSLSSGVTASCMNNDQSIVYACITGGLIYKYTTASGTWTAASGATTATWADIVCDDTGQYVVAIIKNASTSQYAWYSSDFGTTFSQGNALLGTNL